MIASFLIQKRVPRLKRSRTFKKKYIDIDYVKASGGGGGIKAEKNSNIYVLSKE